jgi:disulfide bond formation protein DsbB
MSTRLIYTLGFLFISALLLTSVYLQYFDGFIPCPLCTLQRFCFALLGGLFLLGMIAATKRFITVPINLLLTLIALLGIFLSGRQIWLQHFPSGNNGDCGVSLQYMLKVLPVNEVIQKTFSGSAECTQRGFEFLTLNMAEWAFVWFILFLLLSLHLLLKKSNH